MRKPDRKTIAVSALFLAVLFCGGCSTFRSLFDEDPAVTKQKREQAKKKREEQVRSGGDSEVIPSLFGKKQKEPEPDPAFSSSLTPEELAVLKQTEAASKRNDPNAEVERIHRENRERSDKLTESVFGSGIKDWF